MFRPLPLLLFVSLLAAARASAGVTTLDPPSYVGRQRCEPCHTREAVQYARSHHDRAMQPAEASTVLGNFDNATFTYHGVTSTFFKKGADYLVRTDGADGELHEFRIAYTFGIDPLQQYLIEFADGRIQALNVCWDTRPKAQGGQRWFHLYPNENVTHDDILHWTGPLQNWNHMCAECHSTNVRKNYDAVTNRFATTWSEIDVSCEACHGPASRHVAWAEAAARGAAAADEGSRGLVVSFKERQRAAWVLDRKSGIAKRDRPRQSRVEVETCGRCHARRGVVSYDYVNGRPLADTHRPALLSPLLYEEDGQIKDEDFEYQSFLQSKMYAAGVTCSDCHNPHHLKPVAGNGACSRCHLPDKFDTPTHHFHKAGSPAAQCTACHMPTKNYMVVHARHDHSLRVPRPDLTVKIGTPNACTQCHQDRTPQWAADAAAKWWGPKRAATPHYGEALHLGNRNLPGAERALVALADDASKPGIARATAVALLADHLDAQSGPTIERALRDSDPMMRVAAVAALREADPRLRARLLAPLLIDPVRLVRIDAGRALATVPDALLGEAQPAARRALDEYRAAQRADADVAEAHLNLGALEAELGNFTAAEHEYQTALKLSPRFPATYLNLADLYRQQSRDDEGEATLNAGLRVAANAPDLLHALGLLRVRQKRLADAVPLLERAAALAPDRAHYAYVYAVALHSAGQVERGMTVLKDAHTRHPGDRDILVALVTFSRDAGDLAAALAYARELVALAPQDPQAGELVTQLEAQKP